MDNTDTNTKPRGERPRPSVGVPERPAFDANAPHGEGTLLGDATTEQGVLEQKREQFGHVHGLPKANEARSEYRELTPAELAEQNARPRGPGIRVRATQPVYYGEVRRRTGDVFTLTDETHFSPKSMERVDAHVPERVTSARDAHVADGRGRAGRSTGDRSPLSR